MLSTPTQKKSEGQKPPTPQKPKMSPEGAQVAQRLPKQPAEVERPAPPQEQSEESESDSGESSESESESGSESSNSSSSSSDNSARQISPEMSLKAQFKRKLGEIKNMRDKPVEERKILMKNALSTFK